MATGRSSRIEQVIDDIYELIESCKPQAFSQAKLVVPKDNLYDLLGELRLRLPDEIKRYQKIIANRDALLADAEDQANAIRDRAREEAKQLVNENEITRQAYEQASEIMQNAQESADAMLRDANEEAEALRAGALSYTNDILAEVEKVLTAAYEESRVKTEETVSALKRNLDVVLENRRELGEQLNPRGTRAKEAGGYADDDFDFDENTFLPDMDGE